MAIPFAMRAVIAREDGDHELALSLAQQAIAVAPADPFGGDTVHTCLLVFAATQADQGQHEVAVRLAGAAAAFADSVEMKPALAGSGSTDPVLEACREVLGAGRFGSAWSQGQGMSLAEAVGYATRGRGRRSRPALGLGEPYADRARRGRGGRGGACPTRRSRSACSFPGAR